MRLVLFLAALLVAQGALAHGATASVRRTVGPYDIAFFSYETTTEGESVRISFQINDNATGSRVPSADVMVRVQAIAANGTVTEDRTVETIEPVEGFIYTDVNVGKRGRMVYDLLLPNATARFEHVVCDISPEGELVCGDASPPKAAPTPVLVTMAALGMAAWARQGRRKASTRKL